MYTMYVQVQNCIHGYPVHFYKVVNAKCRKNTARLLLKLALLKKTDIAFSVGSKHNIVQFHLHDVSKFNKIEIHLNLWIFYTATEQKGRRKCNPKFNMPDSA